jgi:hypothetical protein
MFVSFTEDVQYEDCPCTLSSIMHYSRYRILGGHCVVWTVCRGEFLTPSGNLVFILSADSPVSVQTEVSWLRSSCLYSTNMAVGRRFVAPQVFVTFWCFFLVPELAPPPSPLHCSPLPSTICVDENVCGSPFEEPNTKRQNQLGLILYSYCKLRK